MASKQINPNGLAIVETLTAHKGETLAFAEIANLAKVDAKTGYLTSAKKIAAERKLRIEKSKPSRPTPTVSPLKLKRKLPLTATALLTRNKLTIGWGASPTRASWFFGENHLATS